MIRIKHCRKRKKDHGAQLGFTLIELLVVMLVSLLLLAGMVFLLSGTFDLFKTNRNILAVTDSSRRALATMARQLRGALYFESWNCSANQVTFYANVEGLAGSFADVGISGGWNDAPKVEWWHQSGALMQRTTRPDDDPEEIKLASYVTGLTFEYYRAGEKEALDPPEDYDINREAGRIRILIDVEKGTTMRSLKQDVYLRIPERAGEDQVTRILSVTPSTATPPYPWTGDVTIIGLGTHFKTDENGQPQTTLPRVSFMGPGGVTVNHAELDVESNTELTVEVTVDDKATTEGPYDVNVITGTEYPNPLNGGFVVF